MLKLEDICEYIKSNVDVNNSVYSGVMPEKTEKCVSVFNNNRSQSFRLALGGLNNTKYRKQKIMVLIHWGRSSDGAMEKAYEIYRLFSGKSDIRLKSVHIAFFVAYEPQCIGYTQDKIYEYVVPVDVYINKEE